MLQVNGYFELSSDRRGIWHGEDLTGGEGQAKSMWNEALLNDAIAGAYARVLMHAQHAGRVDADGETAYDHARACTLWPASIPPAPWDGLVKGVFERASKLPCLWSMVDGGRWIAPKDAVLVDDTVDLGGAGAGAGAGAGVGAGAGAGAGGGAVTDGGMTLVTKALLSEGVPLVSVPEHTRKLFLRFDCVKGTLSPAFVRDHLRTPLPGVPPPPPSDAAAASTPAPPAPPGGSATVRPELHGHPCLQSRATALALLQYCASDIAGVGAQGGGRAGRSASGAAGATTAGELVGLPLIPVADGSLVRFQASLSAAASGGDATKQCVFVCSSAAASQLWERSPHMVVDPASPAWLSAMLSSDAVQAATNVRVMEVRHVPALLASVLPAAWRGQLIVKWQPPRAVVAPAKPTSSSAVGSGGDSASAKQLRGHPTTAWVHALWEYIREGGQLPQAAKLCQGWPVLPSLYNVDDLRAPGGSGAGSGKVVRHLLGFARMPRLVQNFGVLPQEILGNLPRVRVIVQLPAFVYVCRGGSAALHELVPRTMC